MLKRQKEEEDARREEEEALLDLLRAELEAERARRAAEERRRLQEASKAEMIAANEHQKRLKVGGWAGGCADRRKQRLTALPVCRTAAPLSWPPPPAPSRCPAVGTSHHSLHPPPSPLAPPQAERQAAERASEEDFRRRMLERFAEEDRLEQMNMQASAGGGGEVPGLGCRQGWVQFWSRCCV